MGVPRYRVPPGLAPFVDSCVGYDSRPDPEAVHHGLPSTSLTLIVAFDDPLDCGWLDGPAGRGRFDTLASGLHTRPALIRTHGRQRGIQIALTPLGARALLGMPAGALAGVLADGGDVGLPGSLQRRMQDADWPTRFAHLDDHWRRRAREVRLRPELAHAWATIRRTGGQARVADVAAEVGWSRRHLFAQFTAEFGVGPKEAARIARFERACGLLRAGIPTAEVAHRCGYADQPHLHREWRTLAGHTPAAMLADAAVVAGDPAG